MTFKLPSTEWPFARTVTRARIEEIGRLKPTKETVTELETGLEQARNKLGFVRGKMIEAQSTDEREHYAAREASVLETIGMAERLLEQHQASVRRAGHITAFGALTDEFVRAHPDASKADFEEHVRTLEREGIVRRDLKNNEITCRKDASKVPYDALKDHLYRSRKRLGLSAKNKA
jgi:hypothetical protein